MEEKMEDERKDLEMKIERLEKEVAEREFFLSQTGEEKEWEANL